MKTHATQSEAPRLKKFPELCARWPIFLLAFVLMPTAGPAEMPADDPMDRFGRPVVSDTGEPLIYQEHESEQLEKSVAAEKRSSQRRAEAEYISAIRKSTFPIELEWHRTMFGVGIGATGLPVADLDGDGNPEVIAGAGPRAFAQNDFWYVLKWQGTAFEQVWSSVQMQDDIDALRTADLDGDGDDEVVIGTEEGDLLVFDGIQPVLLRTLSTAAQEINDMDVRDIDGDGVFEATLVDDDHLYVIDLETGVQEYFGSGLGGSSVTVGNVDVDPSPEIISTDRYDGGRVVDLASQTVQWAPAGGFGSYVETYDIDQDGIDEIVGGAAWYSISTYDAVGQSTIYTVSTAHNIGGLRLLDFDDDGRLEIVYGDAQWGGIHSLDAATGTPEAYVDNDHHGVTRINVADVDGDGTRELLFGTGYSTTGSDHLVVHELPSQTLQWKSQDIAGPFRALEFGDVDADGDVELIYGSTESDSGYSDGLYFIHDAQSKDLEYLSPEPTGLDWLGLQRIRHADIDGDPQHELFVVTSRTYTPKIHCYDSVTHELQWELYEDDADRIHGLDVVDLDGDGALELVASGDQLLIYDAATGAREHLAAGGGGLQRIGDVDGDGVLEIVTGSPGGALRIYDGLTYALQLTTVDLDLSSVDLADRDGDGVDDILIGDEDGNIRWLNAATGATAQNVGSFGSGNHFDRPIEGLNAYDLNFDGILDYVFAQNFGVKIYDGQTLEMLWFSGALFKVTGLAIHPGDRDSLVVDDVDGDGNIEIWINLGHEAMRMWEVPGPGPSCFADDFEDGTIDSGWTFGFLGNADQGGAVEVGGALQVSGDGTTLYAGDDHGFFLYRDDRSGDFRMETDVTGFPVDQGGPYRKAGLMARADMSIDAPRAMIQYAPNFGNTGRPVLQFRYRLSQGGPGDGALGSNIYDVPLPVRLALERVGDTYSVYFSTNGGTTWSQPRGGSQGSIDIPAMGSAPLVGLNVVSYSAHTALTAEMDNFLVCSP